MEAEIVKKRTRKVNFSAEEWRVLFEEYRANKQLLQANHSNAAINKRKQEVWKGICQRVNGLGVAERTVEELKAKLFNMKSNERAKDRQRKPITDGGSSAPATPRDQTVDEVGLLEKDYLDLRGVRGLSTVSAQLSTTSSRSSFRSTSENACSAMLADCTVFTEMDESPFGVKTTTVDDSDSNPTRLLAGDEDGGTSKGPRLFCEDHLPSTHHSAALTSKALFSNTSTPSARLLKRKRPRRLSKVQDGMTTYLEAATKLLEEKRELVKAKTAFIQKLSRKADLEIELLEKQQKMKVNQ